MRIHIDHLRVLSWNADEVTGDRSHDNAISLTRRIYGKHTLSQRRSADPTEVVAPASPLFMSSVCAARSRRRTARAGIGYA